VQQSPLRALLPNVLLSAHAASCVGAASLHAPLTTAGVPGGPRITCVGEAAAGAGAGAAAGAAVSSSGPPPRVKLVLLGDSGVGKSCLVLRYVRGTFDESSKITVGS
jgi:hypothetical protein